MKLCDGFLFLPLKQQSLTLVGYVCGKAKMMAISNDIDSTPITIYHTAPSQTRKI